jgi:hypothetical protein
VIRSLLRPNGVSLGLDIAIANIVSQVASGSLIATGSVSPAQLAAGENALCTPNTLNVREVHLDAAGVAFLCSLAAGTLGQEIIVVNDSAYAVALGHEETSTTGGTSVTATNRFACPASLPWILWPGDDIRLRYESMAIGNRWRVLASKEFGANGHILPPTHLEFQAQTAFLPSWYAACDDIANGVHDGVGNANLGTVVSTPTYDQRKSSYRGLLVTDGKGFSGAGVNELGTNSFISGTVFACDAAAAGDRYLFGKYAAEQFWLSFVQNTTNKFGLNLSATISVQPLANKVVTDGVVRLGQNHLDAGALVANARVSGRGEAAVQSTDADITGITTRTGGTTPKCILAGGGFTGGTDTTWIGGAYVISGAAVASKAAAMAKIAHRLGME